MKKFFDRSAAVALAAGLAASAFTLPSLAVVVEFDLLFAEHGLAPDAPVARWQARLEPYWSRIAGGCHLTRDVPRLLTHAGFSANMETGYVAWPKLLAFNFVGTAIATT